MNEKVKIRFLKNAGRFVQGQEIECSPEEAQSYCAVRERHDGYQLIKFQAAMTIDEIEKLSLIPVELGGLSLDEARALGVKNIAVDPKGYGPDSILPDRLKSADKVPSSDEACFQNVKSPDEGKSAKHAQEINASNPRRKQAS